MDMRTNKKPGTCTECGAEVAPGEGSLWWQAGPDDGGDVVGRTPAGWRVTHRDRSACEIARAEAGAERERRAEAVRQLAATGTLTPDVLAKIESGARIPESDRSVYDAVRQLPTWNAIGRNAMLPDGRRVREQYDSCSGETWYSVVAPRKAR